MIHVLPPRRLRGAKISTLDEPLDGWAQAMAEERITGNEASALLYGPEGAGKSYVAAAVANVLLEAGWQMAWLDCSVWPNTFDDSRELADDASSVGALVLDDLGREPKVMRNDVSRVIIHRFNRGLWTIYTTNLNVNEKDPEDCEIAKVYSRALRSRLLGQSDVILMDGRDRRKPNG